MIKYFLISFLFIPTLLSAQLKPGFEKEEYLTMLGIAARQIDTPWVHVPTPLDESVTLIYRAQTTGLDNKWDLWMMGNTPVFSLRGTTAKAESWLENFWSGMLPAEGWIVRAENDTFHYTLSKKPHAAVHSGWLFGFASMEPMIEKKLDSLHSFGHRDIIITGHSQGGALAYLMTAYVRNQMKWKDITFKTYCSAAPKPGNVFFALDYESKFNWSFNVVHPHDWVPFVPFGTQTLTDLPLVNPFKNAKEKLWDLPFPKDIVLVAAFKRMEGQLRDAQEISTKYLGDKASDQVSKIHPEWSWPSFINSYDYKRIGITIVLPVEGSGEPLNGDTENVFQFHMPKAYYEAALKLEF